MCVRYLNAMQLVIKVWRSLFRTQLIVSSFLFIATIHIKQDSVLSNSRLLVNILLEDIFTGINTLQGRPSRTVSPSRRHLLLQIYITFPCSDLAWQVLPISIHYQKITAIYNNRKQMQGIEVLLLSSLLWLPGTKQLLWSSHINSLYGLLWSMFFHSIYLFIIHSFIHMETKQLKLS